MEIVNKNLQIHNLALVGVKGKLVLPSSGITVRTVIQCNTPFLVLLLFSVHVMHLS